MQLRRNMQNLSLGSGRTLIQTSMSPQYFQLTSTVQSHTGFFHFRFRSLNITFFPLLSWYTIYSSLPAFTCLIPVMSTSVMLLGPLNSKSDKNNRKRILVASPHGLTMNQVLDMIKKEHPELERRFITAPVPEFSHYKLDVEFERLEEITGMRKEDFHTMEETISDTVNDLLKMEEEWKKNGYNVTEVPSFI